jgi:hypothetical protein
MRKREITKSALLIVLSGAFYSCSGFLNDRRVTFARDSSGHRHYKRASDENLVQQDVSTSSEEAPLTFLQQAEALRQEALSLQKTLEEERIQKQIKETAKIDGWIHDLFIQCEIDENTQMLNSVDQVFERLKDDRYSQEQVDKIFKRICETSPAQSRSNCSPIMTLLVDAVGKLDCVEKADNPNKRWSGKVERILRKKLFAKDWGFELEEDDDSGNPWKV